MAAAFETVEGVVFTRYNGREIAEWAVKGVKLQHDMIDMDAFACARLVNGGRTYPRVLRLGIFKDESLVKDYVWSRPRGSVYTYALPRNIEDFSEFFRGEPQPWQTEIDQEGPSVVKGIYRAIVRGSAVSMGESTYRPVESLPAQALGTPPTYVR